jgi:hypothetical protein
MGCGFDLSTQHTHQIVLPANSNLRFSSAAYSVFGRPRAVCGRKLDRKYVDEFMTLSTFENRESSQINYQTDDEKLERG